uniref:hypothetical protein n=1 Tax=Pandoraea pnomenusa TaxID=93220 RepID=UPI0003C75BBB|nr:hypothetical protein [Pandoraea pnomenusa]
MASNDFLTFAGGAGANVLSQADYAALAALATGFQAGVAQSAQVNKVLRQSSIMSAVLAQFVSDRTGQNVVDDGTTANILAQLKASAAAVSGDATKTFSVAAATSSQHAAQLGQVQQIQTITATVASNALALTAGPTFLAFRSSALTNGAPTQVSITAALSLTVPSGATLGTVSGQTAMLALLVAYNGGAPVLCVANVAGGTNLDETGLISPTTISAAANSASTIYSAGAVAANSPFRVVGYVTITEATAGTWATAPALVQGTGGQAMAGMQTLGFGQTWQNVSASRALGTTYYNTTSRPIFLSADVASPSSARIYASVNGVTVQSAFAASGADGVIALVIPPGASYSITGGTTINAWAELR